ncbi:MAG: histidinol dehydrogenase [Spirochaetaceae bacterium]|jgi:histidinol dehydrogenase|nr:histidinol dehydrogenase [Spirochaetaceae bacterium]
MKHIKSANLSPASQSKELQDAVSRIIDDVRRRGDEAVLEYARKFDGAERPLFRVGEDELTAAQESVSDGERAAMRLALNNIRAFAQAQRASLRDIPRFEAMPGLILGHKLVPVDAVCCYVPGGVYPLFSTALMLVTPAKVAGVPRIAACSPVVKGTSSVNPKTLVALSLAGADEVYALGGVQAVAAFAYGTAQIAAVDMIVGPGNAFVAEAKRQCYGQVGIDFVAGPSEVMIIADDGADPALVAADLLAQCEHDKNAQGILVSLSETLVQRVIAEIETQLKALSTAPIAGHSWERNGEILLAGGIDEAAAYANERAPEHLELQTAHNREIIPALRNYGALFIGPHSAEVFGDYAAGTNHTLPTARAARYTGGLWVGAFLKTLTFQHADARAARALAPTVSLLARAEGLAAHSEAAKRRGAQ